MNKGLDVGSHLMWSVCVKRRFVFYLLLKKDWFLSNLSTLFIKFVTQVWHAVGKDRKPLRRQYLEAILPPFVAILRRWRPLLAGIHELTSSSDGLNPLVADDRALAADALPLEVIEFAVSCDFICTACKSKLHIFLLTSD